MATGRIVATVIRDCSGSLQKFLSIAQTRSNIIHLISCVHRSEMVPTEQPDWEFQAIFAEMSCTQDPLYSGRLLKMFLVNHQPPETRHVKREVWLSPQCNQKHTTPSVIGVSKFTWQTSRPVFNKQTPIMQYVYIFCSCQKATFILLISSNGATLYQSLLSLPSA